MPQIFFQREDTLQSILVDGARRVARASSAAWTRKRVADGSYYSIGSNVNPEDVALDVYVSSRPLPREIGTSGRARITEVCEFFRNAVNDRATLTIQIPGEPVYTSMGAAYVGKTRETQDGAQLSLAFQAARFATTETVDITDLIAAPVPTASTVAAGEGPAADLADGLAADVDAGTRSTSLLVSFGESLGLL